MSRGKLLIITGPSAGVGKDTIVRMFLERHLDWHPSPSLTTRQPRPGEIDGVDYIFVDRVAFEKKIADGELLEWFETTGSLYGTLRQPVEKLLSSGKNVILRKDIRGALAIKKEMTQAIVIFLAPDSFAELEQRIRLRATDNKDLIEQKLAFAKKELESKNNFDHLVINPQNRPELALAAVEKAANL